MGVLETIFTETLFQWWCFLLLWWYWGTHTFSRILIVENCKHFSKLRNNKRNGNCMKPVFLVQYFAVNSLIKTHCRNKCQVSEYLSKRSQDLYTHFFYYKKLLEKKFLNSFLFSFEQISDKQPQTYRFQAKI